MPVFRDSCVLRPFFRYYGGKWLISRNYPQPDHPVLVEPFAGSAGYAVRHHSLQVVINDADPIIYGVWSYLIQVSTAELNRLPDEVEHICDLPTWVPQEARWLIGFWLNTGSATPKQTMSKWKVYEHSNRGQLYWSARVKQRLVEQVGSIRHWSVLNLDYSEFSGFGQKATWFVDPPYQVGGEHYRFKRIDFKKLSLWCRSLSGQVIVCERGGADWLPFKEFCTSRSARYQFSKESVYTQNS